MTCLTAACFASLLLMRDLGKQRHLLLSLPLSCVAGQNLGRAQAGGGEIQEELEQKKKKKISKV